MRFLVDDPGKTLVLTTGSPVRWLPWGRPFQELRFEFEKIHVRRGPWHATFRFMDVERIELRPTLDAVSLWLRVHLPDEPERRIQQGQVELFNLFPPQLPGEPAAFYSRLCDALDALGFPVSTPRLILPSAEPSVLEIRFKRFFLEPIEPGRGLTPTTRNRP